MKKYLFFIPILLLFLSCKKDSSNTLSSSGDYPFKYEVFCSSGNWKGQFTTADGGWSQVTEAGNNWTYSDVSKKALFIASISVQPVPAVEGITLTVNIYADDKKVKTTTLTTTNENMIIQMSYVNQ